MNDMTMTKTKKKIINCFHLFSSFSSFRHIEDLCVLLDLREVKWDDEMHENENDEIW